MRPGSGCGCFARRDFAEGSLSKVDGGSTQFHTVQAPLIKPFSFSNYLITIPLAFKSKRATAYLSHMRRLVKKVISAGN